MSFSFRWYLCAFPRQWDTQTLIKWEFTWSYLYVIRAGCSYLYPYSMGICNSQEKLLVNIDAFILLWWRWILQDVLDHFTASIADRCDFRDWRYIRKYLGSSSIEAKGSGTVARCLLNRQGLKWCPVSVFQFFQLWSKSQIQSGGFWRTLRPKSAQWMTVASLFTVEINNAPIGPIIGVVLVTTAVSFRWLLWSWGRVP